MTCKTNFKKQSIPRERLQSGWDVWEMEVVGGPNTDCDTCPDYTYDDLVDYYWPALIAGVMEYSDKSQVDYVGHSHGGRLGLSSLNKYSDGKDSAGYYWDYTMGEYIYSDLAQNPVGKYVAVAAPGALNEGSSFVDLARADIIPVIGPNLGDQLIASLDKSHITMFDFASQGWVIANQNPYIFVQADPLLVLISSIFVGNDKISKNLLSFYNDLAIDEESEFYLSNVNINELHLYYTIFLPSHDILVPFADRDVIYTGVNISDSDKYNTTYIFPRHHSNIKSYHKTKESIKGVLRNG